MCVLYVLYQSWDGSGVGGMMTTLLRAHPETYLQNIPLYSALQFFRDVGPLFFSKSTFRWLTSAADKVCGTQCSKKCVILRTRFCTFPSTAF